MASIPDSRNQLDKSKSASNLCRYATRSDLLLYRKQAHREYEENVYNNFERDNQNALQKFTLANDLAGPQIFNKMNSDVVVQDKTWTDRTVK